MKNQNSTELAIDKSCCIVLDKSELYGIQYAARALAEDIKEACGFSPPIRKTPVDKSRLAIVIESHGRLARQFGLEAKLAVTESFVIRAICLEGRSAILISGKDERGVIHAIYHFSQTHLGADPLKFWTGFRPPKRSRIPLAGVDYDSVPPTFRFRGFHLERMNDCHHWLSADPPSESKLVWEKAMETILRLRGNMVKCEPNAPESREVAIAQKMGLMVTQEHWSPLGLSGRDIRPKDPAFDYSLSKSRQVFVDAWDKAIQRYPRPENVIWTLGFRGRGDQPFWIDDPSAKTDAERGAVITEAMKVQAELVRKRYGKYSPVFIYNLWMEGVRFYREGHVKPPEDTVIVWADNGYGTFRSMIATGCDPSQMCTALPEQPTGGKHGVYCHVSMYDMNAPDLAQFVPPERFQREFKKVIEKEATGYLLVNVGRIREQVLGMGAVMEISRDAAAWAKPQSNAAEDYWQRWCSRYFGDLADEARECYDCLYNTPFKWGEWGGWDDYVVGEIGYYRRARILVQEALQSGVRKCYEKLKFKFWGGKERPLREQVDYFQERTSGTMGKWAKGHAQALAVMKRLRGSAHDFFEANVLAQIEIHMYSNLYLHHMAEAVKIYDETDPYHAGSWAAAEKQVRAAMEDMQGVRAAMQRMERGAWARRYVGKYWSGWELGESTAAMFLAVLKEFQLVRRG